MTNFEPIKTRIWDAVKSDNKDAFEKECKALMDKATGDWWRIGWNFFPQNTDEIISVIDNVAQSAHKAWLEAMKCGDAPNEDISPCEGFLQASYLLKKALGKEEKKAKND